MCATESNKTIFLPTHTMFMAISLNNQIATSQYQITASYRFLYSYNHIMIDHWLRNQNRHNQKSINKRRRK